MRRVIFAVQSLLSAHVTKEIQSRTYLMIIPRFMFSLGLVWREQLNAVAEESRSKFPRAGRAHLAARSLNNEKSSLWCYRDFEEPSCAMSRRLPGWGRRSSLLCLSSSPVSSRAFSPQ